MNNNKKSGERTNLSIYVNKQSACMIRQIHTMIALRMLIQAVLLSENNQNYLIKNYSTGKK